MAEYWKSTPKYWCKFCETYVKDTKFERGQHEATGRHQGNIQRSLRGLHRAQENEQREKSRAQAEVARLNGLVPSESKGPPSVATGSGGPPPTYEKRTEKKATLEDRKKQWEQLAAMGITLPDQARGDLAIAGEWKTVSTEVVGEVNEDGEFTKVALNKGVRKRKLDEEEEEQKEAGEIITKRKGWGHTYKSFPGSNGGEDDVESLLAKKKPQVDAAESTAGGSTLKKEETQADDVGVALQDIPTAEEAEASIKKEEDAPTAPAIVFKKRKKAAK
ncbi:hypothetical protein HBI56_136110 [Parastagonospora nodorum]|uniref:U1-type domain-containing protein n=2 Tax=Phaeosphaeria nodorum (strain SN15 / ATCC MYA-4574 / FGSC 10173) TaxID=321614 RepID=A0A7U2FBB2_PHANO|nr:hypothetical protein SNOG_06737 [Parastagonospora nodorum SN15]KAH3918638.1 hypothetical protein HBH56_039200 [Parastagonospora nodorum]EAT85388.1 hypothetical protein SNOG_06737 [Parastagonospora nodorum SN15]KAH3933913.1 hypothetical protein HBH54_060270 [Parastagonospora nodorum]KAH3941082.1 hypothetical protein HBH53_208020 [Parastagonospora nodorum]KAH3957966.1 hypothetical protein HBH51_215700 [Parastagonospora nodorum]